MKSLFLCRENKNYVSAKKERPSGASAAVAIVIFLLLSAGFTKSAFANRGSLPTNSYGNMSCNNTGYNTVYGNNAPAVSEKEIVIIIPSYHNIDWYERNLSSVFAQQYDKYEIVYITDDPKDTDGTHAAVTAYVQKMGQTHRCTLIKNKERRGGLANLYHAIHACPDHAIVLTLDGDDWLKDSYVLARLNKAYQDSQVWMTYGQFETWPMGPKGFCQEIPQAWITHNVIRDATWVTSHLRTFYAWFFKKIKLKDLLYNHDFFMVTWDKAFMYPMLEMAHGRWKFIPDVLYVYNAGTPLNDYKVNGLEQMRCEKIICSRDRYNALPADFDYLKHKAVPLVDLCIYSQDKPKQLRCCLSGLSLVEGVGRVIVLWRAQEQSAVVEYGKIAQEFPAYTHRRIMPPVRLSDALNSMLAGDSSRDNQPEGECDTNHAYCMYTGDNFVATHNIDLAACAQLLEATGAYCFSLACARDNCTSSYPGVKGAISKPHFVALGKEMYAWQFSDGEYNWRNPYREKAVYRTRDLQALVEKSEFDSLDQLHQACAYARFDLDEVGLCFGRLKMVTS